MSVFGGFFQLGFVALDLDAATKMLAQRYGIQKFRRQRSTEWMDAAHAYVDDVMIELMVLGEDAPEFYKGYEPLTPSGIRLHHHGFLVKDQDQWSEIQRMVAKTGVEVVLGDPEMDGNFRFVYLDTRSDLGIYTEYIFQVGPAAHRYDDVPRN